MIVNADELLREGQLLAASAGTRLGWLAALEPRLQYIKLANFNSTISVTIPREAWGAENPGVADMLASPDGTVVEMALATASRVTVFRLDLSGRLQTITLNYETVSSLYFYGRGQMLVSWIERGVMVTGMKVRLHWQS